MKEAMIGALLGLGAMILLMGIVIVAAGGGHGTYLPAKIFFPYAMLAAMRTGRIGFDPLTLAIVQSVSYGAIVGGASKRKLAVIVIASIHLIAATAAIMADTETF